MAGFSPTLAVMIRAAEKAARTLLRDFGEVEKLQVSQKGPGDFVSNADRKAEESIRAELSKAKPGYGLLLEEGGEIEGEDKERRWIVDPLDGTMNFLHGMPHWCISIAFEEKGEIKAGVIYDPTRDEMFMAEKGGGAFERKQRLRVAGREDLVNSMIICGAPRRSIPKSGQQFINEYVAVQNSGASLRRTGSAALDLAYVAAGRADGFWESHLQPWDVAAGYIIVKEAGGFISDIDDHKTSPVYTGRVAAGNQKVYDNLRKTLKSV